MARAFGWQAFSASRTEEVEPALRQAIVLQSPTLIHLKLPVEISTSRATLSSIRDAALKRQGS